MKILAMEKEAPGVKPEQFTHHLKAEARRVWDLYQEGIIRELYFRGDHSEAILILECSSLEAANIILNSLPLVKEGLTTFDAVTLIPYPGFSRLFTEN